MGSRSGAWGVALLVAVGACGYRVPAPLQGPGGEPLRVEVRMFENRSAEPGFEELLAAALAEELMRRGYLEPHYGGAAGPEVLVIDGTIRSAEIRPTSFSSVGLALEYLILVELEVEVLRGGGAERVWRQPRLRERERYLASSDAGVERSNREQALRRIASEVAGRIHDELAQTP
jgi:hypothetical protein